MRSEDLLDIIGEAQDAHVQDAGAEHPRGAHKEVRTPLSGKGRRLRRRLGAFAACFCLVAGAGLVLRFMGGMGGSAGGGGDDDLCYMNYAGPVFPLTALGDADGITAERSIDFDFTPYIRVEEEYETSTGEIKTHMRYTSEANVTDRYVLTNDGTEDQTLTLLYPFAGSLSEVARHPSLAVDGTVVETTFHAGPYAGGYMGVIGGSQEELENGSSNLDMPESYEDYERLLADGGYLASALDEFPVLDQPVTVYRLSDYVVNTGDEATNPTLQMSFTMDYDKTHVLTLNMNGGHYNPESGYRGCSTSDIEPHPGASPENREPEDAFVILLGEDIERYTIQGYKDGGCDEGEEVDGISCTVTRYETTLGDFLWEVVQDWHYGGEDKELLYHLAAELLVTYGPLAEDTVDRYDEGMLESILSETNTHQRVMYLAFDVTIPAGGSVTVEALTVKDESMDYVGSGAGKDGYDMATTLGTNLSFSSQTASVSHDDNIEIVSQNFGFDPDAGVTEVTLDQTIPHYWMEIVVKE